MKVFFFLQKAIERVERLRVDPRLLILYVLGLIALREFFEQVFFENALIPDQFLHHLAFYVFILFAGILIISLCGRIEIDKASRISVAGFGLIVFPPLIDRFLSLRSVPYDYILPRELPGHFLSFFLSTRKAGWGIVLEIAAILFFAAFFVWIKKHSWPRTVLTGLSLYTFIGLAVTPRLFLPFLPPSQDPIFQSTHHLIYFAFYSALTLVLGMVVMSRFNRALPRALWKDAWSFRTAHFIFMTGLGIYWKKSLAPGRFPDALIIAFGLLLMLFLWLSTVLQNNVYDLSIDLLSNPKRPLAQALVPPTSYLVLSFALGILALIMGFSLGGMSFLLTLLALIGSWAYSAPPLRLRQRLFSTLVIGWGSCLAFLIGYFSRTRLRDISLDKRTLFLSLTIFAALSLGPLTKDLKDYQGDLRAGVRTFFTAFGLSKGKKIVSFLLGLSLLTPLLLFHEPLDIVVLTGIAAASSLLFYYREKLIFSQLGYGLAILYCALRIMHFI